jgi:hypothetical protein
MASFVGHDNMDEEINNPNDVIIPPVDRVRHEENDEFLIFKLHFPEEMKCSDRTDLYCKLGMQWHFLPEKLGKEPFLKITPGTETDEPCGYRITSEYNGEQWSSFMDWPFDERPKVGDWLFCGPGDQTMSCVFTPMDPIALGRVFLQEYENAEDAGFFYVARSMNNISKAFQQRKRGKRYEVEIVEGVYGFMTPIAKMAKNVPA